MFIRRLTFPVAALLLAGTPLLAQEAAAPDCDAEFARFDTNGDGRLTEAEASAVYARARIDGVTVDAEGFTPESYSAFCANADWASYSPEEGAPFEGANSFTEEQARDRALSRDFSDVSALTKDDQGIWRGTASQAGAAVDIAIDYKGNVVATPKN